MRKLLTETRSLFTREMIKTNRTLRRSPTLKVPCLRWRQETWNRTGYLYWLVERHNEIIKDFPVSRSSFIFRSCIFNGHINESRWLQILQIHNLHLWHMIIILLISRSLSEVDISTLRLFELIDLIRRNTSTTVTLLTWHCRYSRTK